MNEGLLPLPDSEELLLWYRLNRDTLHKFDNPNRYQNNYGWDTEEDASVERYYVDMHCIRVCIEDGNIDPDTRRETFSKVLDMTSVYYKLRWDFGQVPLPVSIAFLGHVFHVWPFDPRVVTASSARLTRGIHQRCRGDDVEVIPETTFLGVSLDSYSCDDFVMDIPLLDNFLGSLLRMSDTGVSIVFPCGEPIPLNVSFALGYHYTWDAGDTVLIPEKHQVVKYDRVLCRFTSAEDEWTLESTPYYDEVCIFVHLAGTTTLPELDEAWCFTRHLTDTRHDLDITVFDAHNYLITLPRSSELMLSFRPELDEVAFELHLITYLTPIT